MIKSAQFKSRMIDAGKTGAQDGAGFYDWQVRDVRAMRERRDAFLLDFVGRYKPGW